MIYYCPKCEETFSSPNYCIHKYQPDAPALKGSPVLRTMTRRFYVASSRISDETETYGSCGYVTTLEEAINSAKASIESGSDEVRYVVEIIKIVRRKPVEVPIIVEDVR